MDIFNKETFEILVDFSHYLVQLEDEYDSCFDSITSKKLPKNNDLELLFKHSFEHHKLLVKFIKECYEGNLQNL
jgi:hypothetical protein